MTWTIADDHGEKGVRATRSNVASASSIVAPKTSPVTPPNRRTDRRTTSTTTTAAAATPSGPRHGSINAARAPNSTHPATTATIGMRRANTAPKPSGRAGGTGRAQQIHSAARDITTALPTATASAIEAPRPTTGASAPTCTPSTTTIATTQTGR